MKVARLEINNLKDISSAYILFPNHVVLIGDNNTGKSTVFEALDLAWGPDPFNKRPAIDEYDFYNGKYIVSKKGNNLNV